MIDIFILLVILICGWVGGYMYAHYAIMRDVKHFSAVLKNKITQSVNELEQVNRDGIMLTHEVFNNQHYFYNENDKTFVFQANTLEEAATLCNDRIKGLVGCFKNSIDNQVYCFIDGRVVRSDQEQV